jgi:hypothetical protein
MFGVIRHVIQLLNQASDGNAGRLSRNDTEIERDPKPWMTGVARARETGMERSKEAS